MDTLRSREPLRQRAPGAAVQRFGSAVGAPGSTSRTMPSTCVSTTSLRNGIYVIRDDKQKSEKIWYVVAGPQCRAALEEQDMTLFNPIFQVS